MGVVVLYGRVSTAEQARTGYSLPDQLRACRERAQQVDAYATVLEFSDDMGGDILERPGLQAAIRAVQEHRASHFVCMDPDRFSRELKLQLVAADLIESTGCGLVFIDHSYQRTPEGVMFFQFRGAIAQYEKAKIKQRTQRGRTEKLRRGGIHVHLHPFGYTLLTKAAHGQTGLAIHPEEAEWFRRICHWLLVERLGVYRIAKRLRDLQVPTKRGGQWSPHGVWAMLRNPLYKGVWYGNRYDTTGNYSARRRPGRTESVPLRHRPQEEWLAVQVPAIITPAEWDAVQEALSANRRQSQPANHLLSGLVTCGVCGKPMHYLKKPNRWNLRCHNRSNSIFVPIDAACTMPQQRSERIEREVWSLLESWVQDSRGLTDYARQQAIQPDLTPMLQAELQQVEESLAKRRKGLQEALGLVTTGAVTRDEAEPILQQARDAMTALEDRRQRLQGQLDQQHRLAEQAAHLLQRLQGLRDRMHRAMLEADGRERQAMVREIFGGITVYPGGQWTYSLRG